jgi:pimeloyl-ACP methyl ester carboxylesterase
LSELLPGWRITVLEMPGIGGSSALAADHLDTIAASTAEAISALGYGSYALAGFELSSAVLPGLLAKLAHSPARTFTVGLDRAQAWAERRFVPPDLRPRQDGTHLTALWCHLRDTHLLEPADPTQPATKGEPLPGAEELDDGFVAAAVRPLQYATLWTTLVDGIAASPDLRDLTHLSLTEELSEALSDLDVKPSGVPLPKTTALPGRAIWYDYVETTRGRVHLRRAGDSGTPLLVIPTGGGSSEQFSPVVSGLAEGRQVFAVDYFGNGLSERLSRDVTIETLAHDAAAVIEALGFEQVDVWGSHTGSLVGLELAVLYPERVRRAVLEGPVFISPDFQSDLLDNYFPRINADKWGMHIPLIWNWRRDMFMYWPWYRVDRSVARQLGVPSAEQLHLYAIGILESGPTYDQAYRSAFKYDTASRLAKLKRPALICAGPNDMLVNGLEEARRLDVPGVEVRMTPTTVWWPDPPEGPAAETIALYDAYLRQ